MSILTVIGLALGALFLGYLLYGTIVFIKQCYMLRRFKGPLALPLVGNCYDMGALYVLRYLSKLRKKYGKIFTFFGPSKPYLVICEPAVVRRILSDPKTFPKGEDYTTYFNIAFGAGLVTSNGEKHKADRAVFGRFFIRSNVVKFMSTINSLAVEAIENSLVQPNKGQTFTVDIEQFFATLALRTFSLFAVGLDYRTNPAREKEICRLVSKGSFEMGQLMALALPLWDIIPQVRCCRQTRLELGYELTETVKARKALMARGETVPDDCLTAMLTENMSSEAMLDHIVTLLCAGHDTTAFYSSYMVYLLGLYPEAQAKFVEDVKNVVGDREEITADDVSEMKYVQKVMQEVLRLFAIIPNVSRLATEETHVKEVNVTIPKGATVLIPMFLINRDPDIWENPSEFNPDRFEGKGNEFTSAKNGFFPFGYGSRTCIGNVLAQLESVTFLCHLLRKFRIESAPGFKPNIMAGISLTTSNGIHVVLRPLE